MNPWIVTQDGATFYLCWDGPHTRGLARIEPVDVVPAVNTGTLLIRIRDAAQFAKVYNDFTLPGDQSDTS